MKDGGSAFPTYWMDRDSNGMTLRDYAIVHLAAAWVQALGARYNEPGYSDDAVVALVNDLAQKQADAMLAKREKEE